MPSTTTTAGSGSQHCHSCGATVDAAANFCPQCGVTVGDSSRAAFCSGCGEAFESDDEFCSQCGHAREDPGESAQTPGESTQTSGDHSQRTREMFRQRIRDHIEAGWELDADYGDHVTLVDRGIGSIPVHILLFFITSGLGNLLYGWYHYSRRAETRYLSIDDTQAPKTGSSGSQSTTDSNIPTEAFSYLFGGTIALFGLLLLAVAINGGSLGFAVTGAGVSLGGISALPAVKRRLNRRHGVTKFGRLKTVDHRVISPPEDCEESCVVCGGDIAGGLLRRRRDETVFAGVPLATHGMYHNHYCQQCAKNELVVGESSPASAASATGELSSSAETNRYNS